MALTFPRQQLCQAAEDACFLLSGNVVEREGTEHEVKRRRGKLGECVAWNKLVIAQGIGGARDPQHILGDIDSDQVGI